jgi:Fe2+ transport system protein FeoA
LHVVQNSGQGPFVVAVRGSRIVLGRGMAARISVE